MSRRLATLLAVALLYAPYTAQGFQVYVNTPGAPEAIPPSSSGSLSLFVEDTGPVFGWDIQIEASGGMQITGFTPVASQLSSQTTGTTLIRINRIVPAGQSGAVSVGTLNVTTGSGPGTLNVIGDDFVDMQSGTLTKSPVGSSLLALTDLCQALGDADGDGVCDTGGAGPCSCQGVNNPSGCASNCNDNCKFAPNPNQLDRGGLGNANVGDNIGDKCQCGDVTADGKVVSTDRSIIKLVALGIAPPESMAEPGNCDVNGTTNDLCNNNDSIIVKRALLAPAQVPGINNQACANANP